jgi:hypothetical protein
VDLAKKLYFDLERHHSSLGLGRSLFPATFPPATPRAVRNGSIAARTMGVVGLTIERSTIDIS